MTRLALLGLIALLIAVFDLVSPNGTRAKSQEHACMFIRKPTTLVGEASWYGPGFHGDRTATGNVFNQNDPRKAACLDPFTNTLKLWKKLTCVEVTNLDNGRKLKVECRDTGSFCESYGRVIDLSRAGAAALGYEEAGHTDVKVEPVPCSS